MLCLKFPGSARSGSKVTSAKRKRLWRSNGAASVGDYQLASPSLKPFVQQPRCGARATPARSGSSNSLDEANEPIQALTMVRQIADTGRPRFRIARPSRSCAGILDDGPSAYQDVIREQRKGHPDDWAREKLNILGEALKVCGSVSCAGPPGPPRKPPPLIAHRH
jgi:hypothetical protein